MRTLQMQVGRPIRERALVIGCMLAAGLAAAPAMAQYVPQLLVSDGAFQADNLDTNLVNPWGLAFNPTGVSWAANNQTGTASLHDGTGAVQALVVSIPSPRALDGGRPTGIVFNGSSGFEVTDGVNVGPARFIFAGEDGIISGWSPQVPPGSKQAQVAVDSSADGAIYKGLALSASSHGVQIYATDFHNKKVRAFDESFVDLELAFADSSVPSGFAPFNVQAIGASIFVTYALQDENGEDDVPGAGNGFVNEFDRNGRFVRRFQSGGVLNSPWGMALAPADFGPLAGALLIGNFGDGMINAFDRTTGKFLGTLDVAENRPFKVEGLWSLQFGNGFADQPTDTLFFTAGPGDESHGVYGRIDVASDCAADCNGDGVLNIADFVCFQSAWLAKTPAGDCDANGVFDVIDFVCFQGEFLAGCR
jgi:uncharacterized protein (TIGR03118 family)